MATPVIDDVGGLEVGSVDDPLEREADRLADQVLRRLGEGGGAARGGSEGGGGSGGGSGAGSTGGDDVVNRSVGRVRRSAARSVVGAAGGALDGATSDTIERVRGGGQGLAPEVRREMEAGFGADLGRVRLHTGSTATQLNDAMQAQAFTVGNDVFLHDQAPRPSSADGKHLLAHELAHTLQQGGGASRKVRRRLWDSAMFMAETSQSVTARTSSRQKAIKEMLDAYHATYPPGRFLSSPAMSPGELNIAEQRVAEMRDVAKRWISEHTITTTSGETISDGSRAGRRAGMDRFIQQCNSELLMLRELADVTANGQITQSHDVSNVAITQPSEAFSKVKAVETGDVTSAFRRLGFLIDSAVPLDGDAASITIEVKIPIPPGYVGFELSASASRDGGMVSVSVNAGVTGGGSVDIASIGGALGGYLKAKAKTGADVAELMSYGLFRRCRQSNLIPREVENFLWGGANSGAFGWASAEEWSLGVEKRILTQKDAEVESGAYAAAKAKVKLSSIAALELEAKGTVGTKINEDTLKTRKGGAGNANLKSGAAPDSDKYDKSSSRGAQKSVGVGTGGFEIGATGSIGPFSGSLKAEVGWSSDGAHGKKTVTWDAFKISGGLAFTMPMTELMGGGVGNLVPQVVAAVNKLIRTSIAESEAKSGARAGGNMIDAAADYAGTLASLASVPGTSWQPFAPPADPTAGTAVTGTQKYSLTLEFDFKKKEFSVSLNHAKGMGVAKTVLDQAGNATDLVKLDIQRTSRLLKLAYSNGTWTAS